MSIFGTSALWQDSLTLSLLSPLEKIFVALARLLQLCLYRNHRATDLGENHLHPIHRSDRSLPTSFNEVIDLSIEVSESSITAFRSPASSSRPETCLRTPLTNSGVHFKVSVSEDWGVSSEETHQRAEPPLLQRPWDEVKQSQAYRIKVMQSHTESTII